MGEKTAKADPPLAAATTQRHPVICEARIVSNHAWNYGQSLRKEAEDHLQTAESARHGTRKH
jgi:hypothetical protein